MVLLRALEVAGVIGAVALIYIGIARIIFPKNKTNNNNETTKS